MNDKGRESEFEVLGFRVKLGDDGGDSFVPAEKIIAYVQREGDKIRSKIPHLDQGQWAVLVALKLGQDLLSLDQDYRDNIERIQSSAIDAMRFIEEASPPTMI